MADFELKWFPGTCSRITLIALEEIGVPYSDTIVRRPWRFDPEFLELTPKGQVPVLLIDGVPFTETPAILTHLSRLYPEANLLPTGDPLTEIDVLATMSWIASSIHPTIGRLRFPSGAANDEPSSLARTQEMAAEWLSKDFAILEKRLEGREWLYDEWSAMDAYLLWTWFRVVGSGVGAGFDPLVYPNCADHAARCEQRPSVIRALDKEEADYQALVDSGVLEAPAAGLKKLNTAFEPLPSNQVGRARVVTPG
jgi:glutathione S-transferase